MRFRPTHKHAAWSSVDNLSEFVRRWPEVPNTKTSSKGTFTSLPSASVSQYSAAARLVMSLSNHFLMLLAEVRVQSGPLTARTGCNNKSASNENSLFIFSLQLFFFSSPTYSPSPLLPVSTHHNFRCICLRGGLLLNALPACQHHPDAVGFLSKGQKQLLSERILKSKVLKQRSCKKTDKLHKNDEIYEKCDK